MLRSMLLNFYEVTALGALLASLTWRRQQIEDVMNFEDNLHQNDFSRRSPMPMINWLRTGQVTPPCPQPLRSLQPHAGQVLLVERFVG